LFAVVTEPIVGGSFTPLIHVYIAACGTLAVVVIDAPGDGFVGLLDRVEAGYVRHGMPPVLDSQKPNSFQILAD
jgi:hypothetical protein